MTAYLLDTHVLLWVAQDSPALGEDARQIVSDPTNDILMSVANIWEVVTKKSLGREDFKVEPARLRDLALRAGFGELPIRSPHVLALSELPQIHADPFDRILIAQARAEQLILLTRDRKMLEYGRPARAV